MCPPQTAGILDKGTAYQTGFGDDSDSATSVLR